MGERIVNRRKRVPRNGADESRRSTTVPVPNVTTQRRAIPQEIADMANANADARARQYDMRTTLQRLTTGFIEQGSTLAECAAAYDGEAQRLRGMYETEKRANRKRKP